MTEHARNGIVAGAEAARKRLSSLKKDMQLPRGIDPDYYQEYVIRQPYRRPFLQGTIVGVKTLIINQGGVDYA